MEDDPCKENESCLVDYKSNTQFSKSVGGNWRPGGPSYLDTQTFEDFEISVLFNRLNKMCTIKQLFNSVFFVIS